MFCKFAFEMPMPVSAKLIWMPVALDDVIFIVKVPLSGMALMAFRMILMTAILK